MRVVAGTAGGTVLETPKSDLRPTMDLVKGAIFSSLGEFVIDARVLDLFSGSGGLGIESLSRGSGPTVLVENDRLAIESIRRNLTKTRLQATVYEMDVFRYLERMALPASFDLIIADPPYVKQPGDRDFTEELLQNESLRRAIAPEGIFVLEHKPFSKLDLHGHWQCVRQKRYGGTELALLRPI